MSKLHEFWCHKVLPLVYDSSLSYYEVLTKFVNKLNEVIEWVDEGLNKIPTKTSQLVNDSGFVTATQAANTAPVQSVNGDTGDVIIPDASTSTKGIVQLSSSTISNAQDKAATPRAVMNAYDNGTKAQYTAKVTLCQTAADVAIKEVNVSLASQLINGTIIYVIFQYGNTAANPQLRITSPISTHPINSFTDTAVPAYLWNSEEIVPMLYYSGAWLVLRGGRATTDYYGATKLNSSTDSTSETSAATPSAVKAVKDAIPTKVSQLDNDSNFIPKSDKYVCSGGTGPMGYGFFNSATTARIFVPMPNNASAITAVTYTGSIELYFGSGSHVAITGMNAVGVQPGGIIVQVSIASGGTTRQICILRGEGSSATIAATLG